jgi:S1-C subfamily serine protease
MSSSRRSERAEPAFSGVFSGAFLSFVAVTLLLVYAGRSFGMRGLWARFVDGAEARDVTPRSALGPEESATVALFETSSLAVVSITTSNLYRYRGQREPEEIPEGSGSGFVWDEDGHVVTNLHVVKGGSLFSVRFKDHSAYRAELIGVAPDYDLAVLTVDAPHELLKPLPIGESRALRVGQRAFAIGYPFGLEQTLTTGVISGLDRLIQTQSGLPIHGAIQTDAAINPGNSGGPLLDSAGRLVGINTAIASATGANTGVGFAVPVDTVNRIVPRILNEGTLVRAGLGVNLDEDFYATDEGLAGAVVKDLVPDGPAERAGMTGTLETKDGKVHLGDVIVGIDSQEIRRGADLFEALEIYRAGDEVRVRLNRPGKRGRRVEEMRVRLGELESSLNRRR